jgi:alpha-amylase/alpha-mannosidase (GH57 family)
MFISILWHLHQPIYRRPDSREYALPWVNYHLTKNYHPMAWLAEEAGFPCTFNFVPCLLEQIEEYCRGEAVDRVQGLLETDPRKLKPADVERLGRFLPHGTVLSDPAEVQRLALRSFFSPVAEVGQEKDSLLAEQTSMRKKVIPLYNRLWQRGVIELTASAYYHPLLPLIFDIRVGGETLMPALAFSHPEDGREQIKRGREYFERVFGRRPSGIWPSEGGISLEVAKAMAQEGYAFAVTDENILWKTLECGADTRLLYRPYTCQGLSLLFRDREISDLVSFEYWRWPEKDAVSHLLAKLGEKSKGLPDKAICVIALDGENPWAGYRENGVPFLRELYSRILEHPGVTPIHLEKYLAQAEPADELEIVPGTWLGSFSKWVGSPAKNAAWDLLSRTREEFGPSQEVYIAEGSDWFWWFGEENVAEFEALFHGYIKAARGAGKRGGGDV